MRDVLERMPEKLPGGVKVIALAGTIAVCAGVAFVFADRVFSFAVNNFTDYRISYRQWGESPLDRRVIISPELRIKSEGLIMRAEKAEIDVNSIRMFNRGRVSLACDLVNVSFFREGPQGSPEHVLSGILSDPEQVFSKISFLFESDGDGVAVRGLTAISDDIRLKGDYYSKADNSYVSVDMKISVSSALVSILGEDIKSGVFYEEKEGWHSLIINYRGDPVLLKALYMTSASL